MLSFHRRNAFQTSMGACPADARNPLRGQDQAPGGAVCQSCSRSALANAEMAGDCERPSTETSETSRITSGSATGRCWTPAWLAENSAMKQTPMPAATIAKIQSSRFAGRF